VARRQDLRNGRHADEVGADRTREPDLRRRLEGRPEEGGVDALVQLEADSGGGFVGTCAQ
jgi:hypothetical protein